ncbi:MAG TPA: PD-(D/E)XK nuclease family protein [Steroidobacteraceae bacterium]|nr:PD-(D/E)XK nuclease family protein [Steroidobacteraceae bacterium]
MNKQRLPRSISEALDASATLIVPSTQRQAAIRVAWAELQRAQGRAVWNTPRVLTFAQFCERALKEQWAASAAPDRLLAPGAEWAALRELRRDAGGIAEARALLNSMRTLDEWRVPRSTAALSSSPEAELLATTAAQLTQRSAAQGRKPLRDWLPELPATEEKLMVAGFGTLPSLHAQTLRRLGAVLPATLPASAAPFSVAVAENDEHELDLIARWCREQLARDPECRLLIVDVRLRQRRGLYERLLSQTLTPSEWFGNTSRSPSTVFTFEGGRPLAEFPVIAHALLTLRLLTGRLPFEELVRWLRLPFLDREDCFAGAAIEIRLREAHQLEFSAAELLTLLEGSASDHLPAHSLASRLKLAMATLAVEALTPAEWAPRALTALRQLGWHGLRALRSDEQQTVTRWHALLDEYSALGAWLPRGSAAAAVSALADLAAERNFDAASVEAPVTLTDSHDDPIVRYDGIWVAGLDAAQWPAPPRPDVFIPFGLQVQAGIPASTAAGQTSVARASLAAWRASAGALVCSWARLEGDAHRTGSPLLARSGGQVEQSTADAIAPLALATRVPHELFEDEQGIAIDTNLRVVGGVRPLQLQAECAFHAYAELRLDARPLESPTPGIDPRERGMLLHKALELIWAKLKGHFELTSTDGAVRKWMIGNAVEAAVVAVFRGYVPEELRFAVDREKFRLEQLILALLELESQRPAFEVVSVEARREVLLAGGRFEVRIDRVDSIEGGGFAILDYKSGEPRALRWQGDLIRDPQLIAYLLAESGRNVQALANVSLANGRAKFTGKSSRKGLLPDVNGLPGLSVHKNPPEEIDAAWRAQTAEWVQLVRELAAEYIAGRATVEPAPDVCRLCALTTLCRRVELADDHEHPGYAHE